jgi:hypothetical protein
MLVSMTGAAEAWLTNAKVSASAASGGKARKSHRHREVAVLCRVLKTCVLP